MGSKGKRCLQAVVRCEVSMSIQFDNRSMFEVPISVQFDHRSMFEGNSVYKGPTHPSKDTGITKSFRHGGMLVVFETQASFFNFPHRLSSPCL